jgi:Na+-translocating ferredoxin:NAD+ oxidoreductase subunit E
MIKEELKRGLLYENPILSLALGLCPSIAVSSTLKTGLGMGIAVTFVLTASNVIISMVRKLIPEKVRIPCYIVIIASLVTVTELIMQAWFPQLHKELGIYLSLIAVNCIILGRVEAFASKNNVRRSFIDGIVMGLGFTVALCILSCIRELLGSNTLLGLTVVPGYQPMLVLVLAPGGFFAIAFVMALARHFISLNQRQQST